MKKIYSIFLSLITAMVVMTACTTDDPFTTAGSDDTPRFLFPSMFDGNLEGSLNITREETLDTMVIVTPVDYTKIQWLLGDEVLAEGQRITKQFLAGEYQIKILATTTAGKQTFRLLNLNVAALDGDPTVALGVKNCYCQTGTSKTMAGANLAGAVRVLVGKVEAANVSSTDDALTFDVPELEDGEYYVTLEVDEAHARNGVTTFGLGKVTVSAEEYVDPGVSENVVWEGESATLAWNAWEDLKESWADAGIGVGATIVVYVSAEEGAQGAITTSWWNDINTGKQWEEAGLKTDLSGDCTMEYTVETTDFLAEQGFAVVGNGFKVKKVVVRTVASGAKVIWEGESATLAWNAWEDLKESWADAGIAVGKKITVYVSAEEGAQGAITTSWWNDINTGKQWEEAGLKTDLSGDCTMEYTVETTDFLAEQGFAVVGNGFKVKKVTIE